MTQYKDHAPTGFDSKGLCSERIAEDYNTGTDAVDNWIVTVGRTRDSDCLSESNFHSVLKALEEKETADRVDVINISQGHWGCGWIETVLVRPGSAAAEEWEGIARALEQYPVLDEDDYSEREAEEIESNWRNFRRHDVTRHVEHALTEAGYTDDVDAALSVVLPVVLPSCPWRGPATDLRDLFCAALERVNGQETSDGDCYKFNESCEALRVAIVARYRKLLKKIAPKNARKRRRAARLAK